MSLDVINVMLLPVIVDLLEEGKLCSFSPPIAGFTLSITSNKVSGPSLPATVIIGSLSSRRRHFPGNGDDPLPRLQSPQVDGTWRPLSPAAWIPSLVPPRLLVGPARLCSALLEERRLDQSQVGEEIQPGCNTKEQSRESPKEAEMRESKTS